MLSKLNRRQQRWLETATPEQRKAFAAKGPAEVAELINITTHTPYYMAGLRGQLFDQRQFDNYDAAFKHAEIELAHLQADTSLPVLDEVALGIDSGNATINDQLEQATLRAEEIIHLGSMVTDSEAVPGVLGAFIDDLDSHLVQQLADDMPWLAKMLEPDIDDEEGNEEDIPRGIAEQIEFVSEQLYRHACYGFLIQYATPVMKPWRASNGEWCGNSYSWGYYNTRWFYGESLQETAEKAQVWANDLRKQEQATADAKEAETEVAA